MATTLPTNATTTTTTTSNRTTTTVSSMFLKSVYLHDWWLVKANNKRLAVGGFAYRGSQGIRGFYSAAIAKRHDATTLETIDGVTIVISGLINRSRTYQNGFPSEICIPFLLGFPFHWETYACQCLGEESTNRCDSSKTAFDEFKMSPGGSEEKFRPVSFCDLPVTRIHDLCMSTTDSENCLQTRKIFNEMLGKFSGNTAKHTGASIYSNKESISPATGNPVRSETPVNCKQAKVKQKCKVGDQILDTKKTHSEEFDKIVSRSMKSVEITSVTKGVFTRSMTRLRNSRNMAADRVLSNSLMKHGTSIQASSPKASGKQRGSMIIGSFKREPFNKIIKKKKA
ncbi:uncharacterized protein LOC131155005 isoform X1 [Malania oleifera]|uniref:uncharacterized protein LOC131155005 isoform X1 n=1 Tax=Malania oleifera TaxID=397392 RepID=UPI0025AE74BB|nr:uncharacterized protein LOC131155005 isoform X1 [Malania oleifera]